MIDAITVSEFARRVGVTRANVYLWLRAAPHVRPVKIAGLTLLTAQHQRQLLAARKKIGRPKKTLDSVRPSA